jgi:DNA (cytosine-5)-methyltransferase 1
MSKHLMTVHAVDLFAGAGGTSTGLALACQELGKKVELTAINHWKTAIESHSANHPWAKHICANVEALNPREVVPRRHLNILVASPECVGYSCAAGGRPKNDQKRASAWHILRWLELLKVDSILVENVREFRGWGPLNSRGFEIKSRKGEIYRAWLSAIRSFGYNVDTRILNAADYGAPTSRSRLFIAARKGNVPINWPEPTHSKTGTGKRKWHPAREIIDWSLKGQSIFTRKRPLSRRTIGRIIEGLKRFGGRELQPFIVLMEHGGGIKSLDEPLPTITTAKGGSMSLVEPFILSQGSGGAPRSVKNPLPTIPAGGAHALIEPFVLSQGSNGAPRSVEDPLPTIVSAGKHALIESFIIPFFGERKGQIPRSHSVSEPLPAVTSHGAGGLVQPFLVEYHGGEKKSPHKRIASVDKPIATIDTSNRFGLAEPFILPVRGFFGRNIPKSIEEPLGTITQRGYGGLVEPCLVQYNGNSGAHSINEPLPTIPTHDRFGLVQPEVNGRRLDIRFRMLQPHELAGAMGFPRKYELRGTKTDVIRQIGNAVVVQVSKALCMSLLSDRCESKLVAA